MIRDTLLYALLAICAVVYPLTALTGCSQDNNVYAGKIALKSYSPSAYKSYESWSVVVVQGSHSVGVRVDESMWTGLYVGEEVRMRKDIFGEYSITEAISDGEDHP